MPMWARRSAAAGISASAPARPWPALRSCIADFREQERRTHLGNTPHKNTKNRGAKIQQRWKRKKCDSDPHLREANGGGRRFLLLLFPFSLTQRTYIERANAATEDSPPMMPLAPAIAAKMQPYVHDFNARKSESSSDQFSTNSQPGK